MRGERQITKEWYSCDYCGYVITEKIENVPVVLNVVGVEYHFHGPEYLVRDTKTSQDNVTDHKTSCVARWFLAQSHLHAYQEVEGTTPTKPTFLHVYREAGA